MSAIQSLPVRSSLPELRRRLDVMARNGHDPENMVACAVADGLLTKREAAELLSMKVGAQ